MDPESPPELQYWNPCHYRPLDFPNIPVPISHQSAPVTSPTSVYANRRFGGAHGLHHQIPWLWQPSSLPGVPTVFLYGPGYSSCWLAAEAGTCTGFIPHSPCCTGWRSLHLQTIYVQACSGTHPTGARCVCCHCDVCKRETILNVLMWLPLLQTSSGHWIPFIWLPQGYRLYMPLYGQRDIQLSLGSSPAVTRQRHSTAWIYSQPFYKTAPGLATNCQK
jgi:hypothetical protein